MENMTTKESERLAELCEQVLSLKNKKFLVKWLEGYGDAKPEVVALDEIKESDAWDLTDDVIDNLSSLEVGHEYFHYELGSTLNFIKL